MVLIINELQRASKKNRFHSLEKTQTTEPSFQKTNYLNISHLIYGVRTILVKYP